MALLGRRMRCHYCNHTSRSEVTGVPRTWLCPRCDAVNYFDEHGNITDPPVQATATTTSVSFQYARPRSTSPFMDSQPSEMVFCDDCQHNQMLLNKTLAEYLPDEDDPDYEKYVSTIDAYRTELEERYPQVCERCLGRVQDQIRAAGYAAKADHLQRMLEKSSKKRVEVQTSRQFWTLTIIALAKWTYIFNILVGLLWHTFGMMAIPNEAMWADDASNWKGCLMQAISVRQVDESCFTSSFTLRLAQSALVADLLTIWWNPKLKHKTNHIDSRMRGLKSLWMIRISVLVLRATSLLYWKGATLGDADTDTLQQFRKTHIVMLTIVLASSLVSWKIVRMVYNPSAAFMRPVDENLPSAYRSAEKAHRGTYQPIRPNMSSFDTMAQSFSSSFPTDKLAEPTSVLPPSPTLTATSISTHDTELTTPHRRKSTDLDTMDWTPTQRRFAPNTPAIVPSQWSQKPAQSISPPLQHSQEPISLFRKPDPNPFRHKVPAAPKAPAQAKVNPWKPGVWAPPLKENMKNFFKDEEKTGGGESKGLDGFGVPKNVKRDAELFQSPKLKYDYYGTPKDTGLENSFNDLFSK